MTQYARPASDATNPGGWTTQSGGSTNLWQTINDAASDNTASSTASTTNDADFIESPSTPSNAQYSAALGSLLDPLSSSGHILHYRYSKDSSLGNNIDLVVRLQQGTTTIAEWTHTSVSQSATTADQTLTSTQANSITDYTALRFFVQANRNGGLSGGRSGVIYWVELEVPDGAVATGTIAATLQKALFSGAGAQAQTGSITATLKKALFAGSGAQAQTGTISAILQRATAALAGTQAQSGTIAATLRPATMAASGAQVTNTIAATLQPPTIAASGTQEQQGTISATLRAVTMAASGGSPILGAIAAVLQRVVAVFTGSRATPSRVVIPVPAVDRSATVPAVDRTAAVAASPRAVTVAATDRSATVAAAPRTATVPAVDRTLVVAAASRTVQVPALTREAP